jgi:hypothetical protein
MKIKKEKRIFIKDKLISDYDKEIIQMWPVKSSISIQKYFKAKYKPERPLVMNFSEVSK